MSAASGPAPWSPVRRRLTFAAPCIAASMCSMRAFGKESTYPDKPVRFIVGFPAGGGSDLLARAIGQGLSEGLGVPVVIENRGGASGMIGTDLAAKSAADGYTILLGTSGAILTAPSLQQRLPYDPATDFSPIGTIGSFPNVLVVAATSGIRSLADLVAAARSAPGKLVYASSGNGTTLHLSAALLQMLTGIDTVHVPYKEIGQASIDLMEGRIQFAFTSAAQIAAHVRSGRLRPLATTGDVRSPAFPDIPTIAELGYPDYEVVNWYSLLAPRGTPPAVIERLNATLNAMLDRADTRARFARELDLTARSSTPAELSTFIASEQQRWARIIRTAGIATQ